MNKLILLVVLFFTVTQGMAQGSKRDQIKAERIAFLTDELDLSSKEAEKFWPLYNEYSGKDIQLRKKTRELKRDLLEHIDQENSNTPEVFEKILKNEEQQIELKRTYVLEFKKALPEEKVYKVFIAEEKFKRYLLKKLRHRK